MFFSFWPSLVHRQETHAGILCHFSLFFPLSVNIFQDRGYDYYKQNMNLEIATQIIVQLLCISLYFIAIEFIA
jgi:hypothetical protein